MVFSYYLFLLATFTKSSFISSTFRPIELKIFLSTSLSVVMKEGKLSELDL